ncbi:MAG: hypothetical protein R3F62_31520 [Planctomycetota bacterium]
MTALRPTASPSSLLRWALLACLVLGSLASPAVAEDDDDDFETTWIGLRLGGWYRPNVQLEASVSGRALGLGPNVPGTSFNAERDLGVTQNVESDFFVDQAVGEAEFFFDSEWVSLSIDVTAPFVYRGETVLQRTINFAGRTFTAGVAVETKLQQFMAGSQLKLNVLNNRIVALSPLIGMRMIAVDWEIQATAAGQTIKGDTTDLDGVLQLGDYQVLPYPEVGLEVKLGLRKWFEVDAKLSGFYVDFFGIRGGAIEADLGATIFPIPNLGVRLGYRYLSVDFEAKKSDQSDNFFEFDLNFHGPSLSVILRF